MKVVPLSPLRVVFVGEARDELQLLERCAWAETRRVLVRDGAWGDALGEASEFTPDVCIVLRPQKVRSDQLARIGGLKLGIIPGPLAADAAHVLARLTRDAIGVDGFAFYTCFEEPGPGLASLPVLGCLPPLVDVSRCVLAPCLEATAVAVPAWAMPPVDVMERLRQSAEVRVISEGTPPGTWPGELARTGLTVYWSEEALGRLDHFPLVVLANGNLLLSNASFPSFWGIEGEDEYLCRPSGESLIQSIETALRSSQSTRAIRVRAWQKIREAFHAEHAYQRLVHDALLVTRREPSVADDVSSEPE